MGGMAEQAAEMMAALAAAQAAATARLQLPEGLLEQISAWERLQAEAESEWRLKQSRMNAEFEERKRRLQEQQLGTRKRLKEGCDQALRPLYSEGQALCSELASLLVGRLCRMQECVPAGVSGAVARAQQRQMLQGPLARITAVTYGRLDQPLQLPHCPSRGAASVSTGVLVTLEKIFDRNGIPMLSAPDDPLVFHRLSRGNVEVRVPLRLLPARVCLLSLEEATAAMPQEGAPERVFVVRYAGGLHGGPIEPVQILPEGLSLSEYDISFAAGPSALRVEHRTDGPVKCRAEPAAQKQVFADSPVELYTQEVDEETHNIVQVYFSDLRDEVAVDVLNITGTGASLEDAECASFPPDATGAALNYKIIVRDARVLAVLYQEDEQVHSSPFVEHRLPTAGAFVVLPDDTLGVLQSLPRGLVVAREHRELPENASHWAPRVGLRAKGKHPAELPGMVPRRRPEPRASRPGTALVSSTARPSRRPDARGPPGLDPAVAAPSPPAPSSLTLTRWTSRCCSRTAGWRGRRWSAPCPCAPCSPPAPRGCSAGTRSGTCGPRGTPRRSERSPTRWRRCSRRRSRARARATARTRCRS